MLCHSCFLNEKNCLRGLTWRRSVATLVRLHCLPSLQPVLMMPFDLLFTFTRPLNNSNSKWFQNSSWTFWHICDYSFSDCFDFGFTGRPLLICMWIHFIQNTVQHTAWTQYHPADTSCAPKQHLAICSKRRRLHPNPTVSSFIFQVALSGWNSPSGLLFYRLFQ